MAEIDLLEQTRRDDVYYRINLIIDQLQDLGVFPSLVWTYSWDIVRDIYANHPFEDAAMNDYEAIAEGVTLKQIWDKFWEDADKNGFSLEYGAEDLNEAVRDWMIDCDFLVNLEDEEEEDE
jgi:hypothetical protein